MTASELSVLLISEDPVQTELYAELIREVAPCQLDVLSRVESSFDWAGQFGYQLVVIDELTTSGSALGFLERIKRISPATSVIIIAENATIEQAVISLRMGAEDYLKKPLNIEAFKQSVKRGQDRKKVFDENTGMSNTLSLLNSCQMISASLERGKIFGTIRSYLSRELSSDYSAIYRLEADGTLHYQESSEEGDEGRDRVMEEILDIALHASSILEFLEGENYFRLIERGPLTPGLFVFRFNCGSDYVSVSLSPKKPDDLLSFESRLRILKAQIEVTGHSISQYQGVQQLAFVDDATGLYNTRYLHSVLDRQIAQAQSTNGSFAVLFLDADHFKSVNDQHGHLVGTKLLNELGLQLKLYVRGADSVFRYGGDEFVAVLAPCDLATGQAVAERIRQSVETFSFLATEGLNLHITVSIGVALFPEHAGSETDLKKAIIEAADHAMYSAKKANRNQVFIADVRADVRTELKTPNKKASPKNQSKLKSRGKRNG